MPRCLTPALAAVLLAALLDARAARAQQPPAQQPAAPPASGADDPIEALVREGVALREQRRDAEALARFQQAYERGRGARALAQIGLAEQALGRWVAAEAHLREALSTSDPWITQNRAPLEASVAAVQRHLGSLEVVSEVAGAELWLNGVRAGALPLAAPVRVATGSVAIELRAAGYRTATRTTNVDAGESVREELAMVPLPRDTTGEGARAAASTTPPPPAGGAAGAAAPRGGVAVDPRAGDTQRAVGWGLLGGAGAFLLGGVAASIAREVQLATWNDDAMCLPLDGRSRGDACAGVEQGLDAAEALRVVGYVGAGALAVTSVVVLLTAPRARAPERAAARTAPAPRWRCAPESGPAVPFGARCAVRF